MIAIALGVYVVMFAVVVSVFYAASKGKSGPSEESPAIFEESAEPEPQNQDVV